MDDEASIRTILRESLEKAGYQVVEAPDGRAGLQRYREQHVDLVITNLVMPEKDGFELIRELKAEYPESSVIAITGYDEKGDRGYLHLAEQLGAAATFVKPFDSEEVVAAVRRLSNPEA